MDRISTRSPRIIVVAAICQGCTLQRPERLDHFPLDDYSLSPALLALAHRALGGNADLLHARLPRRRLDLAHVLRHLPLELAARQHRVRIERPEEKPVIADLPARERRAGE